MGIDKPSGHHKQWQQERSITKIFAQGLSRTLVDKFDNLAADTEKWQDLDEQERVDFMVDSYKRWTRQDANRMSQP